MDRYDRLILRSNPVGYWPLDDPRGSRYAIDLSGWGLHAALSGTPALASRSINGWVCCGFDGTDDYALAPAVAGLANPMTTAVSMEAWVIADAVNIGAGIMSDPFTGSSDPIPFEIGLDGLEGTHGYWSALSYPGSGGDQAHTLGGPTIGSTYHIAASHDGALIRLYVNGQLGSTASSGFVADNDGCYLGRRHDTAGSPYWRGAIAKCARYYHVLDPATILAHYEAGQVA